MKISHIRLTKDIYSEIIADMFKLIKYLFNRKNFNHILYNGWLPVDLYHDAVLTGLVMKDFEWTKVIIEKYKKFLFHRNREEEYFLSKASYYFYLKDYEKALECLNKISYKNSIYHFYSKILRLQIYYETGNYLSIKTELTNLTLFNKRNKDLKENTKRSLMNFIRYFKKLVRMPKENTRIMNFEIRKFQKELEEDKRFYFHLLWFYEKIYELQKPIHMLK
jgi:tetratricopeptide (TPR) repeat protein